MNTSSRGDKKREIREAQLAWLRKVLDATGKTPSKLAVDSGLADITLTRFLNRDEYEGTLSSLSVRLITEHTGLPGPGTGDNVKVGRFGFEEGTQFDYRAAEADSPGLGQIVRLLIQNRPSAAPWELHSQALEGVGYLPGDIVLVDQSVIPKAGDAVCAQHYDMRGSAETIFRVYEPPVLTGATYNPDARPRPLVVDNVAVKIMGVITHSLRTPHGGRR